MTDDAAHNRRQARRLASGAAAALVAALVGACGSSKVALPPAPKANGAVALSELAHHPEVYADATVAAIGTVTRVHGSGGPTLYALSGGHGTRIVLEPSASAAPYAGRHVSASGVFTVTFKLGYEIVVSKITPVS